MMAKNVSSQFLEAMAASSLICDDPILSDGKLHRFKARGDHNANSWYVLHDDSLPAGTFGCWKRGITESWCSKTLENLQPEEKFSHFQRIQEAKKIAENVKIQAQLKASEKAVILWEKANTAKNDHPYLVKKRVPCLGLRELENELLIPICDIDGNIKSLQFIDNRGRKRFLKDGKVRANHFQIGELTPDIYIAEGYATGATIHEATGKTVFLAFSSGNLCDVAKNLRKKYPDKKITICADNDQFTEGNPGLTQAKEAAQIIGATLSTPVFDGFSVETKPTDFNDLFQLGGMAEVKQQLTNLSIIEQKPAQLEWENPILFDIFETPEIPSSLLPGVYGKYAEALRVSTETPSALAVMSILGVISACLSKQYVVSPKEDWKESINIYTLIALPPANNKSLILKRCTQPLIDWQQQESAKVEVERARKLSHKTTLEEMIKKKRKEAANCKQLIDRDALMEEIHRMEITLPIIPALPELFSTDATPESLAACAHEQGGKFAIFTDEGGIMDTLSGLYSGGNANIDILLKGIDGGEIRINRKNSKLILKPYFTIVMTVQPQIVQNMCSRSAFKGRGLLERFLFVLPKSRLGYRSHNTPPVPLELIHCYEASIMKLLRDHPIGEREIIPKTLTLEDGALIEWRNFQSHIEKELRPEGSLAFLPGWGGKICGTALRLAGLLHLASGSDNLVISLQTMHKALELAALLTKHAIAVYDMMGADLNMTTAKLIFDWIIKNHKKYFTQTDLTRALRNIKKEMLQSSISILVDRNIIAEPQTISGTTKPKRIYQVNPKLLEAKNELA